MTDKTRERITIDPPDGSTILAARHLDATEGRVQVGSTVDAATRSAINRVIDYVAKAHNSPTAPTGARTRYAQLGPFAQALADDHDAIALAEMLVRAQDELAGTRAAVARAENLRDKWLAWPNNDMHYAAGLMLKVYLDGTAYGSDEPRPDTAPTDPTAEQPARTTAKNAPGSTAEQLPDHILALIHAPSYVSTACDTAYALALPGHSRANTGRRDEINEWVGRLHSRCRRNHKFTGVLCGCGCHTAEAPPAPRDPCPHCESSSDRVPRAGMGQHIADMHPEVRGAGA